MSKHYQPKHDTPSLSTQSETTAYTSNRSSNAVVTSGKEHKSKQVEERNQRKSSRHRGSHNKQEKQFWRQKFSYPWYKLLGMAVLLLFLVDLVLELLVVHFGEAAILPPLAAGLLSLLGTIVLSIVNKDTAASENNLDFIASIFSGLKSIWMIIRKNSPRFAVFMISLFLITATGLAKVQAAGRLYHHIRNAFVSIDPYEKESEVQLVSDPSSASQDDLSLDTTRVVDEQETKTSAESTDTILTKNLLLMEPNRIRMLTEDERSDLYFLSGKYRIDNSWDETAVLDAVSLDRDALKLDNKTNLFLYAPEDVKDRASLASQREITLNTSDELDYIKEVRENIYSDYPMYELALLIAENNVRFGLAYDECNRNLQTTEYYYGMSIHWYREALKFNPSQREEEHLLRFIGHRYHDLAACFEFGSENQKRTTALGDAYYSLANELSERDY